MDAQQMDAFKLQLLMNQYNNAAKVQSNIVKRYSDSADRIIGNI